MDKKSFLVLGLIIIAVIGISGCTSKSKAEAMPASAYIGGTSGLAMSFMQNMPPSEFPECTPFQIGITLENKGEATIAAEAANIILSGFLPSAYGIDSGKMKAQNQNELTGRQKLETQSTPGGQDMITFDAAGSKNYDATVPPAKFMATACYPYETRAMATVCGKENAIKQTTGGAELCKSTGEKTVYNSGGPVQVTSVTQSPIGGTSGKYKGMIVNLKLKDMGSGTAFSSSEDAMSKCPNVAIGDIGKIKITEMRLVGAGPSDDCKAGKIVTIPSGSEGFVTCRFTFPQEASSDFEDILQMAFGYAYTESITTSVKFTNIYSEKGPNCPTGTTSSGTSEGCTTDADCPNSVDKVGYCKSDGTCGLK